MAFWDKLFSKKNNATEIQLRKEETLQVSHELVQKPEPVDIEQKPEKKYVAYFSLSNEEEQRQIIDYVRPITDIWRVQNLQMSYGVRIDEADLFMIRSWSEQTRIPNSDEYLHTTHFLVLQGDGCYEVSCTSDNSRDAGDLTFSITQGNEEVLKQAMDFYRNWDLHKVFEEEQKKLGINTLSLNIDLCKPLFKEYEEYTKELKRQKSAQRKTIQINSEQEAKELFFRSYHTLKEEYTEETIQAYKKFATHGKVKEWVVEECNEILKGIADGELENAYDKLKHVNSCCGYFLGADAELLAENYISACKTLFDSGEEGFEAQIPSFTSYFRQSKNPFVIEELLQMTSKYYSEKFSEDELAKNDAYSQFIGKCAEMRGIMRELSPIENMEGFEFVLTPEEHLRQIVLWYRNKYNDDETVKECVAELNCAYGVQNKNIFITGLNETADSSCSQTWDYSRFIAIILDTKEIVEIESRRQNIDGSFVLEYRAGLIKEWWSLFESGMEYYRNQATRKAFFDAYESEHGNECIRDLMKSSHKGLLSRFKRHYEKEYKLAKSNPLSKALLKLVDLCEEKAPSYGYKNTKLNNPATIEEIATWEQENNMLLPDTYKQFLGFANGICVFGASEIIYGLTDLKINAEHLEPDYIAIGKMIGDGTTICMSKTTGKIFIEDHGKYEDKGDFAEFLEGFIEFLEGF